MMKKKEVKKTRRKIAPKNEAISKDNLEECVKDIFSKCLRKLNAAEKRMDATSRILYSRLESFNKLRSTVIESLDSYETKMESIEEAFFILYHNMQKNMFLYANDEQAWWDDYLDLRAQYEEDMFDEVE